jgi:CheY-like chemotaxis protein
MNKAKILVADDDPKFSRLLTAILNQAGGYEAREENRPFNVQDTARDFRPRLIVLNANMDGKDGFAISSEIRNDPFLSKIPIIFVTETVSKAGHDVPVGVLSVSKFVTSRHFLNMVRAACPQFDRPIAASHNTVAGLASRRIHPFASRQEPAAA